MNRRQPYYFACRETGRPTLKKVLVVAVFILVGALIFLAACQWVNAQAGGNDAKREVPHVRIF